MILPGRLEVRNPEYIEGTNSIREKHRSPSGVDRMSMSYDEAMASLTAPGAPFAIQEAEVGGQTLNVFEATPASLRELYARMRESPDEIFLVYEDERWSFGRVMEHVDALGALLVDEYAVGSGDRVAIAMRNYPEWIIAFAAITSVGAIAVSMNAWWKSEELAYGLEDSGAIVLISDLERLEVAGASLVELGIRALVVRADGDLPTSARHLDDSLPLGAALPEVEIDPEDDATILYTSGTTGHPKGAVSSHRAVLSALMAFACRATCGRLMKPDEGLDHPYPPCFILSVPLFHVTGCIAVMLSCFASGIRLVMMYKWDPERALELIERERVTNFVGVPTMSWDLLESPDFERFDTSSLLSVGGGGAPAPPELVKRIDSNFKSGRPGIGYGMTETNAYGPQNFGDDYLRKPTSAGRVVPIVEMRVTDDENRPLGPDEVGEIWFRGPNLIRGYWNRAEATEETIVDGWLRSGDIGRIDEEGFVYVQDRAKDMVLRAGENIYCSEVEAVIYEHPDIHEAAVFGLPHERLGEEVAAAVYPRPGRSLDREAFREFLAARMAGFKVPSHIDIVDSPLPRNPAGKFLKRELRDRIIAENS
jgi:long-chain acyl-CoA synthetase